MVQMTGDKTSEKCAIDRGFAICPRSGFEADPTQKYAQWPLHHTHAGTA